MAIYDGQSYHNFKVQPDIKLHLIIDLITVLEAI